MKAKINKSEKLENEASYLSKLRHEFKTPIHGIRGLAEYLINNLSSVSIENQKKCLHSILSASESLIELTDSLPAKNVEQTSIEFSFTEIDLIVVTKSIIENFRNIYLIQSNINLIANFKIDNFKTKADKFWYEQLLTNLLSNSLNYSKKGTISVNISSKKMNNIDHIIVSVTDEGLGIDNTELLSIFMPYKRGSRTSSATEGTGLGLAICQEVVNAHKGTIIAENNSNKGSTIYFSLPRNQVLK
jgi:signal transduction histidine kinase